MDRRQFIKTAALGSAAVAAGRRDSVDPASFVYTIGSREITA